MQTFQINQPITSKYKSVVNDLRFEMKNGKSLDQAIESSFNGAEFESEQDRECLFNWFTGKFAA